MNRGIRRLQTRNGQLPQLIAAIIAALFFLPAAGVVGGAHDPGDDAPRFMGQIPPGDSAVPFAPGVVSTGANEHGCTFSPDGRELYFTRIVDGRPTIMVTVYDGQGLTPPQTAPFSGNFNDRLPRMSPDGRTLLFESMRPLPSGRGGAGHRAWMVRRTDTGWSEPGLLMADLKSGFAGLSLAADSTLYSSGIVTFEPDDGKYGRPKQLQDNLVGDFPFVAPDESYLIFCAGPERNLVVSFRSEDGWSSPRALTDETGSHRIQGFPAVTPDGRYLFYTIDHDLYWVDSGVIDHAGKDTP